jgi:hypothetical protein
MNKPPSLLCLVIAALALASCQTMHNGTSGGGDRFAKADTNQDGKLDRTEGQNYYITMIFLSRDANHDGKLTWDEWHVAGGNESKVKFDAADLDKDGSLSLDEATLYGEKRGLFADSFKKADKNHDGFVTREEAQAFAGSTEGPPR